MDVPLRSFFCVLCRWYRMGWLTSNLPTEPLYSWWAHSRRAYFQANPFIIFPEGSASWSSFLDTQSPWICSFCAFLLQCLCPEVSMPFSSVCSCLHGGEEEKWRKWRGACRGLQESCGSKCGPLDEPSELCVCVCVCVCVPGIVVGSWGVRNCWQRMLLFWLEHLQVGLWMVWAAWNGVGTIAS